MSRVIYAIVDAPTAETALSDARTSAFDRLVGATEDGYNRFDYYSTFDEENSRLPTKADGSEYPTAARLNTDEGQELLADGWNATKEAFAHDLSKVRKAVTELSNEEIMENTSQIRNRFMRLGEYVGPSIRLYSQYGHGIRIPRDFVLACADLHRPWIVPANIHR